MNEKGTLYLIPSPLSEAPVQDVLPQALLDTLPKIRRYVVEEVRTARRFLSRAGLKGHIDELAFYELNEHTDAATIEGYLALFEDGSDVGLISEAGLPAVADPGFLPVRAALEAGLEPVVIPGVSAVTFSVTASGLPVDRFAFWNFVPVKSGRKRKFFEEIAGCGYTVFCFESPFRIAGTLQLIAEIMPDAAVAVIREATKIHEEILRGRAAELAALKREWRGEFVIGICNKPGRGEEREEPSQFPEGGPLR